MPSNCHTIQSPSFIRAINGDNTTLSHNRNLFTTTKANSYFELQRKIREKEEPLPILPGAKAEPIVAAGELAVDLIHQRWLHHRRWQAPHRNLRPTKGIFHVFYPRNLLQFDWKSTRSIQDHHPRLGILQGLDPEDTNSLSEGIGFLPAKYGSDPRQGHESTGVRQRAQTWRRESDTGRVFYLWKNFVAFSLVKEPIGQRTYFLFFLII